MALKGTNTEGGPRNVRHTPEGSRTTLFPVSPLGTANMRAERPAQGPPPLPNAGSARFGTFRATAARPSTVEERTRRG